jgi:hypothetical protein
MFTCDYCRQPIKEAAAAIVTWADISVADGVQQELHFLHKGECDQLHWQRLQTSCWMPLAHFIVYLEQNTTFRRASAVAQVKRLAECGSLVANLAWACGRN